METNNTQCRCSRLKVGHTVTEQRNWNPDCNQHGTTSDWYRHPEQVRKRSEDSERTLSLQRQAHIARRHKVKHNHMTRDIKAVGVCPACDLYHETYD